MKVILKQKVEKLGEAGDIVKVKDGFARNFLLLKGLAFEASAANLKVSENLKAAKLALGEKEKLKAQNLAKKLQGSSFTLALEANIDDKLYGSLDAQGLAKFLREEGYDIADKNIILDEPIKSLGVYGVDINLHPEVTTTIKIWIVKK